MNDMDDDDDDDDEEDFKPAPKKTQGLTPAMPVKGAPPKSAPPTSAPPSGGPPTGPPPGVRESDASENIRETMPIRDSEIARPPPVP